MKPETLKEIFETRHPQYAKTKDFELVLHYLKEYEKELEYVCRTERIKAVREFGESITIRGITYIDDLDNYIHNFIAKEYDEK